MRICKLHRRIKDGPLFAHALDEKHRTVYTVRMKANDVTIRYARETDSTNRWAMAEAETGAPHGTLFIAARQSAGRGRLSRTWSSEGKGLYMSLLLRPQMSSRDIVRMTMLAALAVRGAARSLGVSADVKWPNDVVANGRKLCGILCESRTHGTDAAWCVLGTGINIAQTAGDFPAAYRDSATSLLIETGKILDREAFIGPYLQEIGRWYERCIRGDVEFFAAYRDALITIGREVRVIEGNAEWTGFATDIRSDGALVVRTEYGERAVYAGDVSVRGKDGYV